MYLVDTDVISGLRKPERNPSLLSWFAQQRRSDVFVSVISIGEIERGIARQRKTNPDFAAALASWLDEVLTLYGDRILSFDLQAARRWGLLRAAISNDSPDLIIAATALEHGLTVVTHNVSDFTPTGVAVLDPFSPQPDREP